MAVLGRIRSLLGRRVGKFRSDDAKMWFTAADIDELLRVYQQSVFVPGGPWEAYRDAHMVLPDWFRPGLDPWGEEYAAQQHRLWALVAGVDRPYQPAQDEKEFGWHDADPVRLPGFYARRDRLAISSAADHVLATGMLLKHSGLQAGDWALEYGAGFGQTALALARLGVNVDTVDISATLCGFVRQQAEHFQVPLNAFQGPFGTNPRPGQRYKLIWFYESFHHCVDFKKVVPMLADHLEEGGRILLGGEPIVEREYAAVPYPWGVRLHSEVAVVIRQTRWFELGFSEDFLYDLFRRAGFEGRRIECEPSLFGRLYMFERSSVGHSNVQREFSFTEHSKMLRVPQ
jgi:SAM-dependent methyltransferase